MTIDELIQLIRSCTLSQVRKELANLAEPDLDILSRFYQRAAKRKP